MTSEIEAAAERKNDPLLGAVNNAISVVFDSHVKAQERIENLTRELAAAREELAKFDDQHPVDEAWLREAHGDPYSRSPDRFVYRIGPMDIHVNFVLRGDETYEDVIVYIGNVIVLDNPKVGAFRHLLAAIGLGDGNKLQPNSP